MPRTGRIVPPSIFALLLVLLAGCGSDETGRFAFTIALTGLPDSSAVGGHYEIWAVVNGQARRCGRFVVVGSGPGAIVRSPEGGRVFGTAAAAVFGPASTLLGENFPRITAASHLFVTIEPAGDDDQMPSCNVLLAGAIANRQATLTTAGVAVPAGFPCAQSDGAGGWFLGLQDFSTASGVFQMLSPTDDPTAGAPNDHAGVWFVRAGGAPPALLPGLDLPPLAADLRYEAFAVVDGENRSLGTFRVAAGRDDDRMVALQRGDDAPGFDLPGGDFVVPFMSPFASDPPALDLTSSANFMDGDFRAFVTLEPARDNDPLPFQIELLSAVIPPDAVNTSLRSARDIEMNELTASLPTVTAAASPTAVTLTNVGLAPLAAAGAPDRRGHFELWADIGGSSFSCGRFVVTGTMLVSLDSALVLGDTTMAVFDAASTAIVPFPDTTAAASLYLTLEDEADDDGLPDRVFLAGALTGNQALLTLAGDGAGLGLANFAGIRGVCHCATPTNNSQGAPFDDNAGIHFRNRSGSRFLELPVLPEAFVYEGWVEDRASGRVYSTGRFGNPAAPDSDHATSPSAGTLPDFRSPGKDFLFDVVPPTYLAAQPGSITEVFVTIESVPDQSSAPSFLRVLEAAVPAGAVTGGVGGVDVPMTLVFPDASQLSAFMSYEETN